MKPAFLLFYLTIALIARGSLAATRAALGTAGSLIPYVGPAAQAASYIGSAYSGYRTLKDYVSSANNMAKSMSGRKRTKRPPSGPRKKQRTDGPAPSAQQNIATNTANPATRITDKQTPNAILKMYTKKKKMSKAQKQKRKIKKKFAKKVQKVMIKLGPANVYKETATGAYVLPAYVGAWNSNMAQQFSFSRPTTSADGFGYGGCFNNGTERLQDCFKLLDYQNNELFLYTAAGGTSGQVESLSALTTASAIVARTTAVSGKVWISDLTYTMSIRNPASIALSVDVYEMVANRNFADTSPYCTAGEAYTQCVNQENFTYDTPGVGERVRLNQAQATPFDIPNYTKYWKVQTGTRMLLDPGEVKMLTFKGQKGWYDGRKTQPLVAIKDFTTEFLFIVGGGPSAGLIATTPMPEVVWTKEIRWRQELGFGKPQNLPLSASIVY